MNKLRSCRFLSESFVLFEVLIQIAWDHAVIELLYLVGALAVQPLEIRSRGEHVYLPRGERAEGLAELSVEHLDLGHRHQPLAVGGICDDGTAEILRAL